MKFVGYYNESNLTDYNGALSTMPSQNTTIYQGFGSDIYYEIDGDHVKIPKHYSTTEYIQTHKDLIIPSSYFGDPVTIIEDSVFGGSSIIENVELSKSLISIGKMAFGNSGIKNLDIPDSVRSIGEGCFQSCYWLNDVTFPNELQSIGNYEF